MVSVPLDSTESQDNDAGLHQQDLLRAAGAYIRRRWVVVPLYPLENGVCTCTDGAACKHPGKHPWVKYKARTETTTFEISRWFALLHSLPTPQHPNSGIGILTGAKSGIVVVDIDPRHGGSLEALTEHGELPETYTVRSGGDGLHLYFPYCPGLVGTPNKLPGIDVRSDGNLVVAPPTLHVTGKYYAVEKDVPLAEMPDWLYDLLTAPSEPEGSVGSSSPSDDGKPRFQPGEGLKEAIALVESGKSFHQVCYALGWRRGADCLSLEEYEAEAKQLAETFGKDSNDAIRTYRDGHAKGMRHAKKSKTPSSPPERWHASAQEFLNSEPKPITWIVDGFIAAGCTILAGPEKAGKSIMALGIAIAVASGGKALNYKNAKRRRVLYIDAENGRNRSHRRFREALPDDIPNDLDIDFQGGFSLLGEGFVEELAEYLKKYPDTFVIVDTRQGLTGEEQGGNATSAQYKELKPLSDLANELQIGILVLDHTVKGKHGYGPDNVTGTRGRTSSVDCIMKVDFIDPQDPTRLTLTTRSRDDDIPDLVLEQVRGRLGWQVTGEAVETEKPRQREMSKADNDVLALIGSHPGLTMKELHQHIGGTYAAASQRVLRLTWKELVVRDQDGRYFIASTPPESGQDALRGGVAPSGGSRDGDEAVGGGELCNSSPQTPSYVVDVEPVEPVETSTTTSSTADVVDVVLSSSTDDELDELARWDREHDWPPDDDQSPEARLCRKMYPDEAIERMRLVWRLEQEAEA